MNKLEKTFCFVQLYHILERGGGAEVQANYLANELSKRGHEVHYICRTIYKNKEFSESIVQNVIIHWLPNKSELNFKNLRTIYSLILQIEPNYVIERMSSTYGISVAISKIKMKLSYIWICTDNLSPTNFKSVNNAQSKVSLLKFLLFFPKYLINDILRIISIKRCDVAFSQNQTQERLIKNTFNKPSFKMISGHPLPKGSISVSKRFNNKTILWCANFGTHKRPELFIELASKMQHTDLNFVMVGGHSDKNYVEKLLVNKPTNLTTTGQLNFDNALSYFNEATIFVNTSAPGGDGFPNTFIQAWLRQVPVISFGFDPDDIIVNNGLGCNVAKIENAVKDIEDLFNDEAEYKKLSQNSYNYALENHSIKKMTDNFIKAIASQ